MIDHAITKTAIDLLYAPSRVRLLRSSPLPPNVLSLLQIVAGDEEATRQASKATGRSRETVREAAAFFIEQVLLYPEADSYRALGTGPEVSNGELRRNMTLLLRWLHPDRDHQDRREVFATRVTRAWNDLKSEERRVAYDRSMRLALAEKSIARKKGTYLNHRSPRRARAGAASRMHRRIQVSSGYPRMGFLRRVFLLLLWKVVR